MVSGIGIALKATATVTFHGAGFDRNYTLDSSGNAANGLTMESRQAFLDLGGPQAQELKVTVIGDAAAGAHLQGANQVLANFTDSVAKQGGIATQGQGVCTLDLTRFGSDGLAGNLDCENVVPDLGSTAPVSFRATIDAVSA